MTKITTHVLDISLGRPAANIPIVLNGLEGDKTRFMAEGLTNEDGRISPSLYDGANLKHGLYSVTFSLTNYFLSTKRTSLYPFVTVYFKIENDNANFHLPLLISPGGYSTYRGS